MKQQVILLLIPWLVFYCYERLVLTLFSVNVAHVQPFSQISHVHALPYGATIVAHHGILHELKGTSRELNAMSAEDAFLVLTTPQVVKQLLEASVVQEVRVTLRERQLILVLLFEFLEPRDDYLTAQPIVLEHDKVLTIRLIHEFHLRQRSRVELALVSFRLVLLVLLFFLLNLLLFHLHLVVDKVLGPLLHLDKLPFTNALNVHFLSVVLGQHRRHGSASSEDGTLISHSTEVTHARPVNYLVAFKAPLLKQ